MIKNNMTKQICAACTLVLIFFISGCLYIPPLSRQTGENDVRKIQVGVTTKQELIELLGEPEILDEGRFSLCDAFEGYGVLIWFAGGMDLMDFANKYYLLLFEFDENNVLKKYQIEGDTVQVFPDKPTLASQVNSIRKLLFKDRVWRFSELTRFKAVAFSPVGTSVAALDQYDHVWLHNIETGEQRTFSSDGFDSLTFSPNGRTLALVGYIVRIVDVSTGSELVAFDGHVKPSFWTKRGATALAFSPDGKSLTAATNNGVYLWEFQRGE